MLFIIGLGLGNEKDITVRGLEAVKGAKRVYLEHYTAILGVDKDKLEKFFGCTIILADRTMVEQQAHDILEDADKEDVALLVVGDPLAATTHTDFIIRAAERKIPYRVIHNASIMNAVAVCGLQLYNFGKTVSIPFFTKESQPESFYDYIKVNRQCKMHTLCLLDIKVKEQSHKNLLRGINKFEPPRFMSINVAIKQLKAVEAKREEKVISDDMVAVAVARVGQDDQVVAAGTLGQLERLEFGKPLHSLVIAGDMHIVEKEYLDFYAADKAGPDGGPLAAYKGPWGMMPANGDPEEDDENELVTGPGGLRLLY